MKQGPAAEAAEKLQFSRVSLVNWKNFTSCDVALAARVFLVGPNASGKSNFLDVFRFVRDLASPGGGLQEAVRRRGEMPMLRSLAAPPGTSVELRIGVDGTKGTRWEYALSLTADPRETAPPAGVKEAHGSYGRSDAFFSQRYAYVLNERVTKNGQRLLDRPNPADQLDDALLTQTHLEQVNANREFRQLASFFESVQYLHVIPQLVREQAAPLDAAADDPFGGDFLEKVAKTPPNTRRARLKRIRDALSAAVPQMEAIELWRDRRGAPHLRARHQHWPAGQWQTEERLSDGTIRLIALLWELGDPGGPLLLEEPELSLHPAIIRWLPAMFARARRGRERQVILSTHSPELLTDEGIGLDEVLLLRPSPGGTQIQPASQLAQVRYLLEGGVPLSEAAMPETAPPNVSQLARAGNW